MNYFVSEYYIKTATTISQNVDIKDVYPNIGPASDMFCAVVLTEGYYNQLLSAYTAQALTADEITLVDKIKPAIAWRAAEMSLPFLSTQTKNKGPQTQSGDFSNSISREDMTYLRNELDNRAQFYEQRLVEYLRCNKDLFSGFPGYSGNNLSDRFDSGVAGYNDGFSYYNYPYYFRNFYN